MEIASGNMAILMSGTSGTSGTSGMSGRVKLQWASDLAAFIAKSYGGPVVEVGAGRFPGVASEIAARGVQVLLTDREEGCIGGLRIEKDDIFSPRPELYRGASLLYSIRPPFEMQLAIGLLAERIGADVLIRPLLDEIAELPGFSRRLLNRGHARFFLYSRSCNDCEPSGAAP